MSEIEGEEMLFEETVVLLRAQTEAAAIKRAIKLGEAETHTYQNGDKETVSWVFSDVLDLIQLDAPTIEDGSEVYHHFLTATEVDQVRESLKAGSLV